MKKGTMKLLSQLLVVVMIVALLPTGLSVSAAAGNITNLTVNPNRPGTNVIKVATPLAANGQFTHSDRTTMTFAHMGTKLKGLTQIITPLNDSNRANATPNPSTNPTPTPNAAMRDFLNSTQEYFRFTPDQPGAVYVLSSINLHSQTDTANFKNNYASWTCVANGVAPTFPTQYNDYRLTPVDYEPTTPYYLTKMQWKDDTFCTTGSPKVPDIALQKSNQTTTANFGGGAKYPYAYKKYFAANTPVSIPVVGTYASNENMIVLVDWNDVETESAKLSSFTYTPNGDVASTVTGFTTANEGGTYNVMLPLGTTSVVVNAKTVASIATVTKNPTDGVVDVSSGAGTYTMTVNCGLYEYTYTINFTVSDKSANAKLSSLTYTAGDGSPTAVTGFLATDNGGTYTVSLPDGAHHVTIQGIVADAGKANITYNKEALTTFGGSIVATVTAEDGSKKEYTVCFDAPNYILNDEFDRHGAVGDIVVNKMGNWSYAAAVKDALGNYTEFVKVAVDPKDPTNKVAQHSTDYSATKWPSLKKDATFTKTTVGTETVWSPLVVSAETFLNKPSMSAYIELRGKNSGGGTTAAEKQPLNFSNGNIAFLGVDTTYDWTANEWIKYSFTIIPNPLDIAANATEKTTIRATITGNGLKDANGNPTQVISLEGKMKMTYTKSDSTIAGTDYINTGIVNVVFNTSINNTGADGAVYLDNAKIYTPTAPTISIPNNSNISVTDTVNVLIDKYEINPTAVIPENIVVTKNSDGSRAEVDKVIFNPYNLNNFSLKFKDGALSGNSTYTVAMDTDATDFGGNTLLGTATIATKATDPITGLSISDPTASTITYGSADSAVFTATTTPESNVDYNTIAWYVDGVQAATGKTFVFNSPTLVKDYVVTASILGNPSIAAAPKTVTVAKGIQNAPAAIEVAKTYNTITITPVEGAEYGVKLKSSADEVVYGTNNVFAGLQSETEYTAYIRMAATALYNPSAAVTADVTTEVAAVLVPSVTVNDVANTIVGLDLLTMEYAVSTNGGTTYGDYTSDAPAAFGGSVKVKVRFMETETVPAGEDVILTFTPNYGDVSGDGIIDISDVIMAAEIAVGVSSYTTEQIKRANVSDKVIMTVDISDVVMIAERAVGGTTTFPIDL